MGWRPVAVRLGGALVAAVGGFLSGLVAVAFYARPWGWWLAVVGLTAALVALPRGWWRTGFGVGWLSLLALVVAGRREGDFAITATLPGYALLAVGLLHLGFVTATLPARRPRQRPPVA